MILEAYIFIRVYDKVKSNCNIMESDITIINHIISYMIDII